MGDEALVAVLQTIAKIILQSFARDAARCAVAIGATFANIRSDDQRGARRPRTDVRRLTGCFQNCDMPPSGRDPRRSPMQAGRSRERPYHRSSASTGSAATAVVGKPAGGAPLGEGRLRHGCRAALGGRAAGGQPDRSGLVRRSRDPHLRRQILDLSDLFGRPCGARAAVAFLRAAARGSQAPDGAAVLRQADVL